jgi:hypothetical protein
MDREEAARAGARCRHYAMCKVDCLGTAVCPSGRRNHYVSYYPQGLMDIAAVALRDGLPLSEGLADVVRQCTDCGVCETQCHFVSGLRPRRVIAALRSYVEERSAAEAPEAAPEDGFLARLRAIVGVRWATSDPAHLAAYATDPAPVSERTVPAYVVLPGSTGETAEVVRLCRSEGVEYAVRGNGGSVMGFVLGSGVVLDTARMRTLELDLPNRAAHVGAGISSLELQREVAAHGLRANTAEPSALYCANVLCSGIFSLFSSSYGTGADNVIDARFVSPRGEVFTLSQRDAPNLAGFAKAERPRPGICTEAVVRLHPVPCDESAIAVPFGDMEPALEYARELGARRLGTGIGLLGGEYLSTFIAPTAELARTLRSVFADDLGIEHLVLVLGDRYHLDGARALAPAVLEQEVMTALTLGMPSLREDGFTEVLRGMEGDRRPYETLADPAMLPLIEAALEPSPEKLASAVPDDLRETYEELYSRPELTDMLWLNTFRIVSARMGREGHVVAFIVYVPLDDPALVTGMDDAFAGIAERCGVRGAFGFLTPLDEGSMAVLEWDMYLDHTDPAQAGRMRAALAESAAMISRFEQADPRVLWIRWLFNQGFARKESFLHHRASLS